MSMRWPVPPIEDQTLPAKVRETRHHGHCARIGADFVWAKHLEPSKDDGFSAATLDAIQRNATSEDHRSGSASPRSTLRRAVDDRRHH